MQYFRLDRQVSERYKSICKYILLISNQKYAKVSSSHTHIHLDTIFWDYNISLRYKSIFALFKTLLYPEDTFHVADISVTRKLQLQLEHDCTVGQSNRAISMANFPIIYRNFCWVLQIGSRLLSFFFLDFIASSR